MTDQEYAKAPVELESYRDGTGVLRTIYGWFPVRDFRNSTQLTFDLDATAEIAPNSLDRAIVRRTAAILRSNAVWNRADDRKCPSDASAFSLYCAMEKATIEVTGAFSHRRPALEVVRVLVDKRSAGRGYNHRLMDWNNDPRTTLADVQALLIEALQRMSDSEWLRANGFATS